MKRILAIVICGRAALYAQQRPLASLPYTPSLEPAFVDKSVDPCADFFRYACGNWNKINPIPADQPRWSVYGKMAQENQQFLWGVLEEAAKATAARKPNEQKIGDFFGACMDQGAVERAGAAPLKSDLDAIQAIGGVKGLAAVLGRLHLRSERTDALFGVGPSQDYANSESMIAFASSGGLGLPDRDYYTMDDAKSAETRTKYVQHVTANVRAARRQRGGRGARGGHRDGDRDGAGEGEPDAGGTARPVQAISQDDAREGGSDDAYLRLRRITGRRLGCLRRRC